jgi:hypothetical protein
MSDMQKVEKLVSVFTDGNEAQCATAREELRVMEKSALQPLEMLRFRQEGNAYTEVFKTLIIIGDDIFSEEGKAGLSKSFLKTINSGANKSRQYAAEEVHTLSAAALTRWGFEIPSVLDQKIFSCHVCDRKSTELRVGICSLHTCDIAVCKEHAQIIETRFGLFDGSGGAWFCTEEHHKHAIHNHTDWN